MNEIVNIPVATVIEAARALSHAGRWARAAALLDDAGARLPQDVSGRAAAARLALAAADLAVDSGWYTGENDAAHRLSEVDEDALDEAGRWDLEFARVRFDYREAFGSPSPQIRRRAQRLAESAPDPLRLGWAHMYLGLIADNLFGERDAAPPHYEIALRNSSSNAGNGELGDAGDRGFGDAASGAIQAAVADGLLRREAQRHLGDHDHDRGDHTAAAGRWQDATATGARAGAVPGTLSQQLLLAVLHRDAGNEAGATALAAEVARWATAIGATRIARHATAFLDGVDPTQPPAPEPEPATRTGTATA